MQRLLRPHRGYLRHHARWYSQLLVVSLEGPAHAACRASPRAWRPCLVGKYRDLLQARAGSEQARGTDVARAHFEVPVWEILQAAGRARDPAWPRHLAVGSGCPCDQIAGSGHHGHSCALPLRLCPWQIRPPIGCRLGDQDPVTM